MFGERVHECENGPGLVFHSDQFRGVKCSFTQPGGDPGDAESLLGGESYPMTARSCLVLRVVRACGADSRIETSPGRLLPA